MLTNAFRERLCLGRLLSGNSVKMRHFVVERRDNLSLIMITSRECVRVRLSVKRRA